LLLTACAGSATASGVGMVATPLPTAAVPPRGAPLAGFDLGALLLVDSCLRLGSTMLVFPPGWALTGRSLRDGHGDVLAQVG